MKRYIERVGVLLLAAMLISCGGGGGDTPSGGDTSATPTAGTPGTPTGGTPGTPTGGTSPSTGGTPTGDNPTPPPSGGDPAPPPSGGDPTPPPSGGGSTSQAAAAHFEESDAAVTLSDGWIPSDSIFGWSGGKAVKSSVAGASATFTFTGTSVRWLASRGRAKGIALVKVDGGDPREVDLFARPNDEIRTPAITIDGLTPGQHTLTIEVTGRQNQFAEGNAVDVDAFDVQPEIVSHRQDIDPDVIFSGTWDQADTHLPWSGSGVANVGDPVFGAKVAETPGANISFTFRGTSIKWIGYSGPDAGIASVKLDEGDPVEVDTYSPASKVQQVVFTATGLADATHTLTITATGRKRDASTAAKIIVDAFDITTPGRRHQVGDPKIFDPQVTFDGSWNSNVARVWSEGMAATSQQTGDSVTFVFDGTAVTWIGCEKSTIGRARVFVDGVLEPEEVNMNKKVGIEGYQYPVFRKDGLTSGTHTLRIEISSTNRAFVVVDAFDVVP